MKRVDKVSNTIRDSKLLKIEVECSQYSNENHIESTIKLTFIKYDKELIELILINPTFIELFDDKFNISGDYIELIKTFENGDTFEISLDPYDERIDKIEERDNYVFKSKAYKINTKNITNRCS